MKDFKELAELPSLEDLDLRALQKFSEEDKIFYVISMIILMNTKIKCNSISFKDILH